MEERQDLISRQAAIALANSLKDDLPDDEQMADAVMAHNEGIMEYQTKLSLLPSAQPDVPDTNVGKMDGDALDEAIRHCDEIVQDITWFCNSPSKYIEQIRHESAVKLRQLASWLRELKRLRTEVYFLKAEKENEPVDLLGDVPCKTCKWRVTTTEKCEECIDGVSDNYEEQEPCEDAVSREAVIDVIGHSDIFSTWYEMDDTDDIVAEVIDEARKQLVDDVNELPSVTPKCPECDDAVSREAAIDAALSAFSRGLLASPDIRKLPSVQPERKHGEWTKEAHCPFCDFAPWYEKDIHTLSYCPNCGADLRAERRTDD